MKWIKKMFEPKKVEKELEGNFYRSFNIYTENYVIIGVIKKYKDKTYYVVPATKKDMVRFCKEMGR